MLRVMFFLSLFIIAFPLWAGCDDFYLGSPNIEIVDYKVVPRKLHDPKATDWSHLSYKSAKYFKRELVIERDPEALEISFSNGKAYIPPSYLNKNGILEVERAILAKEAEKLIYLKKSSEEIGEEFLIATRKYLSFQGVEFETIEGSLNSYILFTPNPKGHALNRLAFKSSNLYGYSLSYDPIHNEAIGCHGFCQYESRRLSIDVMDMLYADFTKSTTALHELMHAQNHHQLDQNIFSLFHGDFKGKMTPVIEGSQEQVRLPLYPDDPKITSYTSYQHLSELPNHTYDLIRDVYHLKRSLDPLSEVTRESHIALSFKIQSKMHTLTSLIHQSKRILSEIQNYRRGDSSALSDLIITYLRNSHLIVKGTGEKMTVEFHIILSEKQKQVMEQSLLKGDSLSTVYEEFTSQYFDKLSNFLDNLDLRLKKIPELTSKIIGDGSHSLVDINAINELYQESLRLRKLLRESSENP